MYDHFHHFKSLLGDALIVILLSFYAVGLVAEVDCTSSRNIQTKFCDIYGIESFPTIMYGDPNDLEEYNGGRSYEDLAAFAKDNLVPLCSPMNLDLCDEETRDQISKYLAMPQETLHGTWELHSISKSTGFQYAHKLATTMILLLIT